ncbi:DNA glycosylase AlkZ-like family protein [Mycetocola spongiae]|uniref:DNA glycosylase AlkZ-like family protein n=1 Tax=Mycetocola spongiae TaxID=2859226 RepID=UPI001CF208AF|nr:crosslink repair DNA glycosylase YcaQ family protein [Mycetocola spongiae]UCR88103.1 winged helix DNA-binding domain-containing protein [Mycetocola spongiae]
MHKPPVAALDLNLEEARTLAVTAQGVPGAGADPLQVLRTLGLIQLDALARVDRAHRLTVLARLPREARAADIDGALWSRAEALSFETYTHAAVLIPIEDWPLFHLFRSLATKRRDSPALATLRSVRDFVAESNHGVTLRRIEESAAKSCAGDCIEGKRAAEHLVWRGDLVTTDRRLNRRIYDIPERRIPREIAETRLEYEDTVAGLTDRAVRSLGIATLGDVAHFYNLALPHARAGLALGTSIPVTVDGWDETSWVPAEACPLLAGGSCAPGDGPLICPEIAAEPRFIGPFDPLIRDRERARRLFDFDYTFEAYKPAAKRVYGHYVLGVLLGSEFLGRVDARREGKKLRIAREFVEPNQCPIIFHEAVGDALETLAEQMELTPVRGED